MAGLLSLFYFIALRYFSETKGRCILDVGRSYGPHVPKVVDSIYMCAFQCIEKCIQTLGAFSVRFFFLVYIFFYSHLHVQEDRRIKNKVYNKNTSKIVRSIFKYTARRKVKIQVAFCLKLQTSKFCTNRVPFCKIKTIRINMKIIFCGLIWETDVSVLIIFI